MKLATSFSTAAPASAAFAEAASSLIARLGAAPDHLFLSYTEPHDPEELARAAAALPPRVRVHGSSSCRGVMTSAGVHGAPGPALGMLGIVDTDGGFGVAAEPAGAAPRAAGARAVQRAIEAAGRAGEVPSLIWLTAAPSAEEDIMLGIEDVIGPNVPVFGGSSGAQTIQGGWSQVERGQSYRDAALVSALFPSGEISFAFSAGYAPTPHKGKVTRAARRIVHEIDGLPAAEVYNRWTGGVIAAQLGGGSVVEHTALYPVGRLAGWIGKVPQYLLIHPNTVDARNAMTFGANIAEGDELVLMTGSRESLIGRVGSVADAAQAAAGPSFRPAGALIIFCAGCMLALDEERSRLVNEVRASLGDTPFLGSFTFGEQGCFITGMNHHGNLSISAVLFGA